MRTFVILFVAALMLSLFCFRGRIAGFSKDLLQPDLNPQLVAYLQGDWVLASDPKSLVRIKRDSIIKMHNDTLLDANRLSYVFSEAASSYFTKDSSFVFSAPGKVGLTNQAFTLKEVDNASRETVLYTLIYVSKAKMEIMSPSGALSFHRLK